MLVTHRSSILSSRRRRRIFTATGANSSALPADPPIWPAGCGYVICTTPRSGSWLLSDALASLGIAGRPREWFNRAEEQLHCARWRLRRESDLGLHRYLLLTRALSATTNGVYGVKLHYYQFSGLPAKLADYQTMRGLDAGEVLQRLFPGAKHIWLTRRDKTRQAISFLIARRTQQWWRLSEVSAAAAEPVYDPIAIRRAAAVFARNDERWRAYFERFAIAPLVVAYEDLAASYEPTLRRTLGWLGLPEAETIAIAPPRLRRQADNRSDEWAERYSRFEAALGSASDDQPGEADGQIALERAGASRLTPLWRRWVDRSRHGRVGPAEIAAVLARHGFVAEAIREALET